MSNCFKGRIQKETNIKIYLWVDTLVGEEEGLDKKLVGEH